MATSRGFVLFKIASVPFSAQGMAAAEGTEIICLHAEQIAALEIVKRVFTVKTDTPIKIYRGRAGSLPA
jgi:hypothetical protein